MAFISSKEQRKPKLQTVDRALNFLEIIAESPNTINISEASERLGINLTTCYHLYNTLLDREYIERNADGTLRLGNNVATLYEGYRQGFSNQEEMFAIVRRLSDTVKETAFISLLVNHMIVLTAYFEGPHPVKASGLFVGLSGMEYVRASGKAVLAFTDPDTRQAIINRSMSEVPPAQKPVMVSRLEEELRSIKRDGYAIDDEGYELGVVGLAVPYFSRDGVCMGAIGVWCPKSRWEESRKEIIAKAKLAADEASHILGV